MSLVSRINVASLQKTVSSIQDQVLGRLTPRNKSIGISVAVALTLIYIIRDQVFKPPRNIRHIPYFGYYSIIKSIIQGDSMLDRGYKVSLPLINSANSLGLYSEPGRSGWEIHVSDPEDAKRILLKHENYPKTNVTEGNETTLLSRFVGGPNVLLLAGHHWKNQRKVANPAFHRSLPIKLFGKLGQELFVAMDTSANDTMNISKLLMRLTLEAIGRAGFDFKFNALTELENNEWVDIYNSVSHGLRDLKYVVFPSLEKHFLWLFPERKQIHANLDKFLLMLDHIIEHKRNHLKAGDASNDDLEESEKDILTLLIESEGRGEGMLTNEELKANLCLFFFAGHDTTSSALTSCMYYLATHPDVQQRAREEAYKILGDEPMDVQPTVEDTKNMTYINQVIKETLRLADPAPRVVPRRVTEDAVLTNAVIPKGSLVTVNIFNVHHREQNWTDGDQFNPDRFGDQGEAEQKGKGYIPFGNGARQCLGMNFSLNEQRVVLSMLLRKYRWTLPENSIHKDGLITSGFPIVGPNDLQLTFQKLY